MPSCVGSLILIQCSKLEDSFCWLESQLWHLSVPLGVRQDAAPMRWNWGRRGDVSSLPSTLRNIPAQLCIMCTSMHFTQWGKCVTGWYKRFNIILIWSKPTEPLHTFTQHHFDTHSWDQPSNRTHWKLTGNNSNNFLITHFVSLKWNQSKIAKSCADQLRLMSKRSGKIDPNITCSTRWDTPRSALSSRDLSELKNRHVCLYLHISTLHMSTTALLNNLNKLHLSLRQIKRVPGRKCRHVRMDKLRVSRLTDRN